MEDILKRFKPRDAQGRLARSWSMCVDCASYRPTRRGFWASKLAKTDTSNWGREEGKLWQSAVTWFAAGVKVQCPACRMAEHEAEELEH